MNPYLELAKLYSQKSSNDLAFSARPDAPVRPYVRRRRSIRRAPSLTRWRG
jgi:hypothetical protein